MFELLSTEQDYHKRLEADEQRIYIASTKQLLVIDTWNDYYVRQFVEVSKLMNELHRLHQRYNYVTEHLDSTPDDFLYDLTEESFCMNIAIGKFSTVLQLSSMDECDALYGYLAVLKMNRFDNLVDNFDIAVLIETLVSHDCYIK